NDADAAGLAEMRWGAGRGCKGTVVMLTFGTGIGTALFAGGKLFPNTELGHLELGGMDAEKWASARVRTAENLDFPAWIERVNDYLAEMHRLFWPDVFILGGAVSERFPDYDIDPRLTELVAEAMRGGHNQYAPMEGVLALRERIAAKLLRAYGRAIDPESEITVTLGATEAIFSAIQAAVGAGDEVIA